MRIKLRIKVTYETASVSKRVSTQIIDCISVLFERTDHEWRICYGACAEEFQNIRMPEILPDIDFFLYGLIPQYNFSVSEEWESQNVYRRWDALFKHFHCHTCSVPVTLIHTRKAAFAKFAFMVDYDLQRCNHKFILSAKQRLPRTALQCMQSVLEEPDFANVGGRQVREMLHRTLAQRLQHRDNSFVLSGWTPWPLASGDCGLGVA